MDTPHTSTYRQTRGTRYRNAFHTQTRVPGKLSIAIYLSIAVCLFIRSYLGMCITEAVKSESREDAGSLLSLSGSSFLLLYHTGE